MPTPTARTAVVLVNPTARRAIAPSALAAAAAALQPRGWRVSIEEPASAADARARAERHARAGVDALIACGGDGVLHAVVNGVRDAAGAPDTGSTGDAGRTEVGVIPTGTANVWAAEAGVPRDPVRALALLHDGERRRVDIGVVRIGNGDRVRFLLVCGAGLDAAAVEAVEQRPHWKGRLGHVAYGLLGLTMLAAWPPIDTRITIDGDEARHPRLFFALAANTRRYGGVVALAHRSALDDGLLEVTTFEGDRALPARLALAAQALRGGLDTRTVRGVTHRQASTVTITPARPLPVEVDGESIGRCGPDAPLQIEVEHRALTMIVGAGAFGTRST